jgi:hypothetical protein
MDRVTRSVSDALSLWFIVGSVITLTFFPGANTHKTLHCALRFVDLVLGIKLQSLLQAHVQESSFLGSFLFRCRLMELIWGVIHGGSIDDNCQSSDESEESEDEHG